MLTSGMTGYVPNKSDSAVDAPDKPFVSIGDPHVDDESRASFNSQISRIFKVPGKRTCISHWLTAGCRITPLTPSWRTFRSAAPRTALSRSVIRPPRRRCSVLHKAPCWTPPTPPAPIMSGCLSPLKCVPKIYWHDSWKTSDFDCVFCVLLGRSFCYCFLCALFFGCLYAFLCVCCRSSGIICLAAASCEQKRSGQGLAGVTLRFSFS